MPIDTFATVLEFRAVSKRYEARTILNKINLTLMQGERLALMGPSGSGKSTLLNCAGAIDLPNEGSIVVEGVCLNDASATEQTQFRREHIGTVFQFFNLLPHLTAYENIELPLQLVGVDKTERRARVRALLEETQIHHRADAYPEKMSGGEMQRVAIARAIAHRPKLILADEPTGNLDSKTGNAILDLLRSVSEQHSIALLMATHSETSTRICHRVLHLFDGTLAMENIEHLTNIEHRTFNTEL